MVRFSGSPVRWRAITTTKKDGTTTTQMQATVSYVDDDGKKRRKTKLFPAGGVDMDIAPQSPRHPDKVAKGWLKDLDAEQERLEAERLERERQEADRAELVRLEAERQAAIAADPYATMTAADYASQFVEGLATAGDIERSTAKSYRGAVRHIREGFPAVLLRDLDPAAVKSWRDALLAEGYAAASVTKWLRVLSEAMKEAVNMEIIDRNPCNAVRAPKRKPAEPNSLTPEGYARLAMTLDMLEPSPVVVAAAIAMHCGLRVGEVCGTRWREYDPEAHIIHVCEAIGNDGTGKDYTKRPKTLAGTRNVPVPEPLALMLERRRALQEAELQEGGITLDAAEFGRLYVIGNAATGKFASPTIIERQFKGLAESFGLVGSRGRRMTMHGLRDSYATLSITKGADVRSVAGNLGHSNPSITLGVYADALPEGKRRASDLLAGIVSEHAGIEPYAELARQ